MSSHEKTISFIEGEFWQRMDSHLNGCGCPKFVKYMIVEQFYIN